jgi:hypothetical protein
VYLFHPSTLGATTVYNTIILPRVQQYGEQIKGAEEQIKKAMQTGGF